MKKSSWGIALFDDENAKLKSLLSQSPSEFFGVLFLFNGSLRYKFSKEELCVKSPAELLSSNGYGIFNRCGSQSCYLYNSCVDFRNSMDGFCGAVYRHTGDYPQEHSYHLFMNKSRSQIKLLYLRQGEVILEHHRLNREKYSLTRQEKKGSFLPLTWKRFNEILSSRTPLKREKLI